MSGKRTDGVRTRLRVLKSACEVFSDKGYRDATIADICGKADANIAAVNYHFGDKETLYATALRHAYETASRQYPIDGGLSSAAPARDRLRAHVEAHLRRTFSDGESSHFPRIIVKEMAEPTFALHTVVRDVLQSHREHLRGILRELLGSEAPDTLVRLCVMSIISQCYFFGFNRAMRERHFGAGKMTEDRLRRLIDHITDFCLSGIRGMREQIVHAPEHDGDRSPEHHDVTGDGGSQPCS